MRTAFRGGASILFLLGLLLGCSEEASSPGSTVQIRTQLGLTTVRAAAFHGVKPQGHSPVDSLRIERVRLLLKRLKLHAAGDDTLTGGRDVKVGPFVAVFNAAVQLLGWAEIPAGTYRWLKLEFHRFSDSEAARYAADSLFRDFATADRPSLLIEGTVFVGDSAVPFIYRSDITANVALTLEPPAPVAAGEVLQLLLRFEPQQAFREGNTILDPRDPRLKSQIDNNLRAALKALKQSP